MTAPDRRAAPARTFRPEIDGLRALAVLVVIAFHAEVPFFDGGFVGVDVFFVISGFLITSGLVDEHRRTGSIAMGAFWLRRARRLLPAVTLLVSFVLVVQMGLTNPLGWGELIVESFAASTYWSNELFSREVGNYFGSQADQRPLLHTWSLSVEEQFYIAWPILVSVAAGTAVGRDRSRRLIGMVAVVGLVSVVLSGALVNGGEPAAYYGTMSRAWEFVAGAGLALATRPGSHALGRVPAPGTLTAVGLVFIAGAVVLVDRDSAFPWPAALFPVAGTLAVLAASSAPSPARSVLRHRFAQMLGRLSYSWYLWHWPLLVMGEQMFGEQGLGGRVALVAVSLVPAAASYRFVETPLRRRLAPSGRPDPWRRREVAVSLLAPMLLLLAVVAGAHRVESWVLGDPLSSAAVAARNGYPDHLSRCWASDAPTFEDSCVFGSPNGTSTVLVIGDSHAAHWMAALDAVGQRNEIRVLAVQLGNCAIALERPANDRPDCVEYRASIEPLLDRLSPELVVMASSEAYVGTDVAEDGTGRRVPEDLEAWQHAHEQLARQLASLNSEFLVINDIPRYVDDPLECLVERRDASACSIPRAVVEAHQGPVRVAEEAGVERAGHGTTFDPVPLLCGPDWCSPVADDGRVVMQDDHHLTNSYSESLGAELEPIVVELVGR